LDLKYVELDLKYVELDLKYVKLDLKYVELDLKYVELDLKYVELDLKCVYIIICRVQVGKISTLTEALLQSPTEVYSYRCNLFILDSYSSHFISNYTYSRSKIAYSNSTHC